MLLSGSVATEGYLSSEMSLWSLLDIILVLIGGMSACTSTMFLPSSMLILFTCFDFELDKRLKEVDRYWFQIHR